MTDSAPSASAPTAHTPAAAPPRRGKPVIRATTRAMLIRDGHILLLRADDPGRPWYFLPGGGVDHGETLEDACIRELREETGIHARVIRPVFLREFIAARHSRRSVFMPEENHAVALIFLCEPDPARYRDTPLDRIGEFPGDVDGTGATTAMVWMPFGDVAGVETMPPHVGRALAGEYGPFPPPAEAGIGYWPDSD